MPGDSKRTKGWGLPATIWTLGWISFFADICSEMVYPVLPLYLTALGAPRATIGLIEGLAEGLVSVMKGWSGLHSDRTGKRTPYIRWGYGLSALGKPILAIAPHWGIVLLGRMTDRFGKGIRTTARDALIADAVEPAKYGRAYGFHRGMDTLGALVGVATAYALLEWIPGQYRTIFLLAGIPGAISVVLTLMVHEVQQVKAAASKARLSWKEMPADYKKVVWVAGLFALANTSDAFLLLRAKDLGYSEAGVVLVYLAYNLTYVLVSYPGGALSDRFGRTRVMAAGWVLFALVYVGFGYAQKSWVVPLFLLYGCYNGLSQGATKALVAQTLPGDRKGTGIGYFAMGSGLATVAGSYVFGRLWDSYGAAIPFVACAVVTVFAALLVPFVLPHNKHFAS